MGGGVVQGQGTLHRHIVEVAQNGLGVGHGSRTFGKWITQQG
jgi:hypothetical protein